VIPHRSFLARALVAFAVVILVPLLSARAQGEDASPPSQPSAPPAQVASPPPAPSIGGCNSPGVLLSRPWVTQNSQVEWWAWGLAYSSSVGVNVVDQTGRSTSLGSFTVDSLCEAGGVVPAGNRSAGNYTLVITGLRPGGGPLELTTPIHIATASRPSTSGISPSAPNIPLTLIPCQATAAISCP
jgi:hypothetical protein